MKPLVSLIICTYSRPQDLTQTLNSLVAQAQNPKFDVEVVIVDNSPDGRMRMPVDPFYKQFPERLLYVHEREQGKSRALNKGVYHAKGNFIAFTDDDVIADSQWLSTIIGFLMTQKCDGVGGRVLPIYPDNTPQWVKDHPAKIAGGVVVYDYGEQVFRFDARYYPFIGCNYAFRREVFDSCGLFRTDVGPGTSAMGEDTEFIERLLEQGKVLYYCGQAVIRHPVDLRRLRLGHIAKWHIALGRFAARREVEKHIKIESYYWGVPRYLWKGIILDGCSVAGSLFNRIKFIDAWRAFFRKIGMIREYSDMHRRNK